MARVVASVRLRVSMVVMIKMLPSRHFFVTNRTARLNRASCASFGCRDQAVGEWKESVARNRAAFERKPAFVRFPNGNPRSVNARHLAGANPKCPVRLGVYDGV